MGSLTAPTSRLRFASTDLAIPLIMSYVAIADVVQAPFHHDTALINLHSSPRRLQPALSTTAGDVFYEAGVTITHDQSIDQIEISSGQWKTLVQLSKYG